MMMMMIGILFLDEYYAMDLPDAVECHAVVVGHFQHSHILRHLHIQHYWCMVQFDQQHEMKLEIYLLKVFYSL